MVSNVENHRIVKTGHVIGEGNLQPVKAFLKICSKPKNFKMLRLTVGWNLKPPLYGPRAELN